MKKSLEQVLPNVELLAPNYYTNELPYHNYNHINETLGYFDELCERLENNDVEVNQPVGRVALLLHDANFHEDHIINGFDTKEKYSAHIARILLRNLSVEDSEIQLVEDAIIATTANVSPTGNTQKAVRYADVGNVYGRDYGAFVKNYALLAHEAVKMKRPINDTFVEHRELSLSYLQHYLSPFEFETRSSEYVMIPDDMNFAARNIATLSRATLDAIVSINPVIKKLLPNHWF